MLNFIRIHPWRLEIAPAVAAALAFGSILCYQYSDFAWSLEQIARAEGMPGLPRLGFAVGFALLLLLWFNEIAWNHMWVVAEKKQRTNWVAPLMQSAIIGIALLIFELVRSSFRLSMSVSAPELEWLMLTALLSVGVVATLAAELTRTPTKKAGPEEPGFPPNRQSEAAQIPYVEVEANPYVLISAIGVAAIGCLPVVYRVPTGWVTMALGLAGSLLLLLMSLRKVRVTEEAVGVYAGVIRKRVPLSDVESCAPLHQEPLVRHPGEPGQKKPKSFFITTGRCLKVVTKRGEVFLFGMVRPKHACGLVHHLKLVREETPGNQS